MKVSVCMLTQIHKSSACEHPFETLLSLSLANTNLRSGEWCAIWISKMRNLSLEFVASVFTSESCWCCRVEGARDAAGDTATLPLGRTSWRWACGVRGMWRAEHMIRLRWYWIRDMMTTRVYEYCCWDCFFISCVSFSSVQSRNGNKTMMQKHTTAHGPHLHRPCAPAW